MLYEQWIQELKMFRREKGMTKKDDILFKYLEDNGERMDYTCELLRNKNQIY